MSDVATETPQPSRAQLIEQAWTNAQATDAEAQAQEPAAEEVKPEDFNEKPAEAKSVAPGIREFIRSQRPAEPDPETTALREQVSELTAALNELRGQGQAPKSAEDLLLEKMERLEAESAERAQREQEEAAQAQYDERLSGLRAGAMENINARKDNYPGLMALGQQETVVNALFQRLDEGVETSEDEVASEVESGLREVYEKLHAVYGKPLSEEPVRPSESQQTLNPDLQVTEQPVDFSKMSRREKIDYLWAKNQR